MLKHYKYFSILISLLVSIQYGNSQNTDYFTTGICDGNTSISAESCFVDGTDFEIEVSGEGTLGMNNRGIIEAYIDVDQSDFFSGSFTLVSPTGATFQLADGENGFGDFPGYTGANGGQVLDVAFRNFTDFFNPTSPINPSQQIFYPNEFFDGLNDGVSSADGTWKINACNYYESMDVFCARLTFGTICPELEGIDVVNPTCPSGTGTVTLNFGQQGANTAGTVVYSVDGVNFNSNNNFVGLAPGDYDGYIGIDDSEGGAICTTSLPFSITSSDTEPPVFSDCPSDVTVFADELCFGDISLIDPTPTDNCGIVSSTASETDPDGNLIFSVTLVPGDSFDYSFDILGDYTFDFTTTDEGGNVTTCQTIVTLEDNTPPVWTNQTATITGQCGVDNIESLAFQAFNQLTATDNCSTLNIFEIDPFYLDPNTFDAGCGNTGTSTWRAIAQDASGNGSTEFGLIIVTMEDTQAPVLSGIPADVTIGCNDAFPDMPIPTAIDLCEGDISDQVTVESINSGGSCLLGQNADIFTYTFEIEDGCGNGVSVEWKVTVLNDEAVELGPDILSCVGLTETLSGSGLSGEYLWSTGETTPTIDVNGSGLYSVTVTGVSGCCSVDDIAVTFNDVPEATATGGTLDCSGNPVQLMGSSTISSSIFDWTGPGGFTSNMQNPFVSQEGTYVLTVTGPSGICFDIAETEVLANTDVPNISTTGGDIDCNNTSVTLMGGSTTPDVTFAWSGPGGFSSSMQNPTVTVAGTYELTVTAPNSCIAEGVAVVNEDTTVPSLTLQDEEINCDNSSATLSPVTDDSNATYAWTGPGGFTSSMENPTVTVAGTYNLVITSDNGCTNTATSVVTEDIAVPNLAASGEQITCANPSAQLTATSTTSGVTYSWTGPNGFSSSIPNPTTMTAGTYSVTVEATNGCNVTESVSVTADIANPVISSGNEVLDCATPELNLPLTITGGNNTIAWTGPNGFSSTEQNPTVSAAGTYNVVVTGSNGCTSMAASIITQDIAIPNATAAGGTITCTTNSVQLMGASTTPGVSYSWTGPNDFLSTIPNPTVGAAGTYTLTVTAPNGCNAIATAVVTADGDLPNISATGGELNCVTSSVTLTGNSTTSDVTYLWTGPAGFSSTMQNVDVTAAGIYTLAVTAPNGCQSTTQVNILNNDTPPTVTATGGMISCTVSTSTIMADGGAGTTYAWTGPGGFTSTMQNPTVSAAGDYTVTATAPNGCTATAMASVTSDDQLPSVVALGGTLTCEQPSVILTSNSSDQVTYSWTGPGGFTSTMQNPVVMVPGEYILTVTAPNGCSTSITVTVDQNDDLPQVNIPQPVVDCDAGTATIRVESNEELSYRWTFNGNVISTGEIVVVSMAGTYDVLVTSSNGCTVNLSYTLTEGIGDLQTNVTTTDATSSEGGTATLEVVSGTAVSIVWDNGQTGTTATDLSAGIHTVTITDGNGCMYTEEFEIKMNTATADIKELTNFQVYPTAVNNGVTLSAQLSENKAGRINIYNQTGQLVNSINVAKTNSIQQYIDMSETTNGIYIITLHIDGKVKTTKVFKY